VKKKVTKKRKKEKKENNGGRYFCPCKNESNPLVSERMMATRVLLAAMCLASASAFMAPASLKLFSPSAVSQRSALAPSLRQVHCRIKRTHKHVQAESTQLATRCKTISSSLCSWAMTMVDCGSAGCCGPFLMQTAYSLTHEPGHEGTARARGTRNHECVCADAFVCECVRLMILNSNP